MPKLPRPSFRRRSPATPGDPDVPAEQAPAADPSSAPTTPIPALGDLSAQPASEPAPEQSPASTASQETAPDPSPRRGPTPPSLWPDWLRRLLGALAFVAMAGIGFAIGYLVNDDSGDSTVAGPAPPIIVESAPQPESTDRIGFPEFATRNTTRVGGADAIADGAGVALASYPSLGGVGGPAAVIMAPSDSWQAALAAAPLTADPIAAPVLLSDAREVPDLSAEAVAGLAPEGIEDAEGVQVLQIAGTAVPEDLETVEVGAAGDDVAEIAKQVDAERARLTGEKDPDNILVVSSEDPAIAMPAASWAARSGDPILFVSGDEVPAPTLDAIAKHKDTPVYVLGAESLITPQMVKELEKKAASVTRISNETDPVESSIEFARYSDGDFGWNINDPGHGFVIANSARPLDAAVAAPLSAGGKPGPLLVTTDGQTVPAALQGFFTDTQPGFLDDPSRAVYNHVWLLGDAGALSVAFQAQVDELVKLAPVSAGTSGPEFGPVPGAPEDEAAPRGSGSGGGAEDQTGDKAAKDGSSAKDDSGDAP